MFITYCSAVHYPKIQYKSDAIYIYILLCLFLYLTRSEAQTMMLLSFAQINVHNSTPH